MRTKWTATRILATAIFGLALAILITVGVVFHRHYSSAGQQRQVRTSTGEVRGAEAEVASAAPLWAGALSLALFLSALFLLQRDVTRTTQEADWLARTVEDLGKQVEMLQSILTHMDVGVVVADETGAYVNWNPAAERLGAVDVPFDIFTKDFGFQRSQGPASATTFQIPLAQALRGEIGAPVETFVRNGHCPQGAWVSAAGSPLRDSAGRVCGGVVILTDVTRQKVVEEEAQRLRQDLGRSAADLEPGAKEQEAA